MWENSVREGNYCKHHPVGCTQSTTKYYNIKALKAKQDLPTQTNTTALVKKPQQWLYFNNTQRPVWPVLNGTANLVFLKNN